jgi:single-strand DNA-binding protein
MINSVALTGRLTRDIDLRYTQGGTAVASFTLAVNRNFTNAQGERESDFLNCVIWRKSAENFTNFTRKGSLVGVQGRLQARSYENNQGQRVYVTEVIVENFALLESKATTAQHPQNTQQAQNQGQGGQQVQQQDNYAQRQQNGSQGQKTTPDPFNNPDPFAAPNQQIDISDDDLPF